MIDSLIVGLELTFNHTKDAYIDVIKKKGTMCAKRPGWFNGKNCIH